MRMTFTSDSHGQWTKLHRIIEEHREKDAVICLGDQEIGTGEKKQYFPGNYYFLMGNHDNPHKCKEYGKHFLGRYGFNKELNLFFISGAWSIDQDYRVEGISWWPEEELSIVEGNDCVALYEKIKPRYVISHDCPGEAALALLDDMIIGVNKGIRQTRTGQLLNRLFEIHRPELWTFGHYHSSFSQEINGTQFTCLDILETKTLTIEPHSEQEHRKKQ